MTRRLLDAGYAVNVWNRSPEKCAPFRGTQTHICATPAEAAADADFVLMCLLDTDAVERTVFGLHGVTETIRRDCAVVDFSTISAPWVKTADAKLRAATGARWIDAPVSGGVGGASAGTLTIFLGGDDAAVAAATPVLRHLGQRLTHFGPTGSGLAVKMCNQAIVASHIAIIAEAVSLAEHEGLDPSRVVEALRGGWADSTLLGIFGPRFATGTDAPPLGQIYTMLKDIGMVTEMAEAAECPMPVATAAATVYRNVAEAGHLERDLTALMSFFRSAAKPDRRD
ncbi:MAG: NAD(P)-dependent oxidoreductase [Rhodobacteraceae bacterium]|nr:NAD(P)-dependent oxidoreductase [Paracoccaceae bacterium]